MRVTFRHKLFVIVGVTLLGFLAMLFADAALGERQAKGLDELEARLVPKLELGLRLEADFDHLQQALQEAVAAEDDTALERAKEYRDALLTSVAGSTRALEPAERQAIDLAVNDYWRIASDVSRRLIARETGDQLTASIQRMQAAQAEARQVVEQHTSVGSNELAGAFAGVRRIHRDAERIRLGLLASALAVVLLLSWWVSRSLIASLTQISRGVSRFATGDFGEPIVPVRNDELSDVAKEVNQMAASLRQLADLRDRNDWVRSRAATLVEHLHGELTSYEVAERALTYLAEEIGALAGAAYRVAPDGTITIAARYAHPTPESADNGEVTERFVPREGLVGQAALRSKLQVIESPPKDYLTIRSGLGHGAPQAVVLLPLRRLEQPLGVMEFALFEDWTREKSELLSSVQEPLAIALEVARARAQQSELLKKAQEQAQQLAAQEEELRVNNQELSAQQDELRAANEELEQQREALLQQTVDLESAQVRLQEKADELGRVSSYKSQFLASMSHELRTPLNSMLLLSQLMADNDGRNLTEKQVDYCRTIHSAGEDLLALINQVLDLARIESGKEDVYLEQVELIALQDYVRRMFGEVAQEKGLVLDIAISSDAPAAIFTDRQRVERVLANLVGNAIKFTSSGQVTFHIERLSAEAMSRGRTPMAGVALIVSDTGPGIGSGDRERIFAPFEQVKSSAQPARGGTGLGLAIARESARLLGGDLYLESSSERGSKFVCVLPERAASHTAPPSATRLSSPPVQDDLANLQAGEAYLLVIEDDATMAEQLVDLIHARRFKAIVTARGEEGLRIARERKPAGIILDVKLPDLDGWTVMERLCQDEATCDIPVHFVSGVDAPERGLALGAVGYLTKPARRRDLVGMVRRLTLPGVQPSVRILVIEDNQVESESLMSLLEREGLDAERVASASAAVEALASDKFGCVVLDLGLPDMDGLGLLESIRGRAQSEAPRVVVYTARSLTRDEMRRLEAYSEAVILKDGPSEDRLLEELRLFVRHVHESLPDDPTVRSSTAHNLSFEGRRLLVVDDDMRTVYALSALLQGKGAEVLVADNGREALSVLETEAPVDAVLMDVMMPEMDGYEAVRRLREQPRFASLPIISLTAKAMKGERERCLANGSTAYLSKPVNGERLLETLAELLMVTRQ